MKLKLEIDLTSLDQERQGEQIAYVLRNLADFVEDGNVLDKTAKHAKIAYDLLWVLRREIIVGLVSLE